MLCLAGAIFLFLKLPVLQRMLLFHLFCAATVPELNHIFGGCSFRLDVLRPRSHSGSCRISAGCRHVGRLGSEHCSQDDVAQRAQTDSKERVEEDKIALTLGHCQLAPVFSSPFVSFWLEVFRCHVTDAFVHPGTMVIPANDA